MADCSALSSGTPREWFNRRRLLFLIRTVRNEVSILYLFVKFVNVSVGLSPSPTNALAIGESEAVILSVRVIVALTLPPPYGSASPLIADMDGFQSNESR